MKVLTVFSIISVIGSLLDILRKLNKADSAARKNFLPNKVAGGPAMSCPVVVKKEIPNQQPETRYATTVLNVRSGPSVNDKKLRQVRSGAEIQILAEKDGWVMINRDPEEWVHSDYITTVPPLVRQTSPKIYEEINEEYKTNIDFSFLSSWEGDQYRVPYIPYGNDQKVAGASGITIGTGVDAGQGLARYQEYGLSDELYKKLKPYEDVGGMKGLTKDEAELKLRNLGSVTLSVDEADELDRSAKAYHVDKAVKSWNGKVSAAGKEGPLFQDLSAQQQTVLLSRVYNGSRVVNETNYIDHAVGGDWNSAIDALSSVSGPSELRSRLDKEIEYLRGI